MFGKGCNIIPRSHCIISLCVRYKLVGDNICHDWKICHFCFIWNGMAVHHGSLPDIHQISRSKHELYVRQISISSCFICWNVGKIALVSSNSNFWF